MGRLDGKRALISGTGGGIGRAAALACAREGAHVVGCDLNPQTSAETVELVRAGGGRMDAIAPVDLATEEGAGRWVREAVDLTGGIDVLVNNASAIRFGPIDALSFADWSFTIRHELDIVFLVTRAAWPHLVAGGGGSIVNVASLAATFGMPYALHYTTSKAGVIGFTRALAREVGEFGITVNALTPGMTQSETQVASSSGNYLASRVAGRAIERVQVPADLVGAVMFLSSPASDFMTGQTINVDGGKSMH